MNKSLLAGAIIAGLMAGTAFAQDSNPTEQTKPMPTKAKGKMHVKKHKSCKNEGGSCKGDKGEKSKAPAEGQE